MTQTIIRNRPDALGVLPDSKAQETKGFTPSRYEAAIKRIVARLLTVAAIAEGPAARGKRRQRALKTGRPQIRSNTIRVYLKSIEIWSFYSQARWGRELEPREITTDVAQEFVDWMSGEADGPDTRRYYVRALGEEYAAIFDAVVNACRMYGQANITQILESLSADARSRLVMVTPDSRVVPDIDALHKNLGRIIRAFRSIVRNPTSRDIRAQTRRIWSDRERDPNTYTYVVLPRPRLKASTIRTHLASLSAIWTEMSKPSTPDEPPLAFNPWTSLYHLWNMRMVEESRNAYLRGEKHALSTPLVRAMIAATSGSDLECRRDAFVMMALVYEGLRAEELTGLLRKDLRQDGSMLYMTVLGKKSQVRVIPVFANTRDAWVLLTGTLEEQAKERAISATGELVPTFRALYAQTLLQPDAPAVPSLIRWGCNTYSKTREPDNALEPLDTSGLRAIIARIADRAKVKEVATGEVRGLTECTPECKNRPCDHEKKRIHPHAFRHYTATAASQGGVPLKDIQHKLGHRSIEITERYITVPAQVSVAVSAGVYQTLNKAAPLTPDELASLHSRSTSPIDEPTIIEASLEEALAPDERRFTGPAGTGAVASPIWAYERAEATSHPFLGDPHEFSRVVKMEEASAQGAIVAAQSAGDPVAYAQAVRRFYEVYAKHLRNTLQIGTTSRLPWWKGRANRWSGPQQCPLPSYAQFAPENGADATVIEIVKGLHADFAQNRGPTAATALLMWVEEILSGPTVQLALLMSAQKQQWISFEAEAVPSSTYVREHLPLAFEKWLRTYGGTIRATGYKNKQNQGNLGIAALDTLPDWFFVQDPLADPKHGLALEERREVRDWIEKLQGRRASKARYDQWIEQMTVRMQQWRAAASRWSERTGLQWKLTDEYPDAQGAALATEAKSIAEEVKRSFPQTLLYADVSTITQDASGPEIRSRLVAMLASEGIKEAQPPAMSPVLRRRVGFKHLLDPSLLTFNASFTIEHTVELRKWWYERYGTDSECVVRRAVRTLWDRRKSMLASQRLNLITRHFDVELSTVIPCAKEIEERIRDSGWKAPQTPDEVFQVCRNLWRGAVDQARQTQGITPDTPVPEEVEQFWRLEMPKLIRIVEGKVEATEVIDQDPASIQTLAETEARVQAGTKMTQQEAIAAGIWPERPQAPASARMLEAQQAAEAIGVQSRKEALGYSIDPAEFRTMLKADVKFIIFVADGHTWPMSTHFLRMVEQSTRKALPKLWFSSAGRFTVSWPGGVRLLDAYTAVDQPMKDGDSYIVVNFMRQIPNAWTESNPQVRWPGYPAVDEADLDSVAISRIGWPEPEDDEVVAAVKREYAMRQYASIKRSLMRANAQNVPDGWTDVPQQPPEFELLPDPVEFIFAAMHGV